MASIHPALTVNNIRNFIPINLDLENGQYTSWVELLMIHCTVFDVLDHIIPSDASSSSTTPASADKNKPPPPELASWDRQDAIVKQWIYGTVSNNFLMNFIKPKATANQAWDAIAHLFQDNQVSRAIALKTRLTNTKLESFPNISTYCQELKVLANQLANVEAPISDADLVLQLVTGLTNTEYDVIGMFISQTVPLPTFSQARSRLTQEETRRAGHITNQTVGTALLTTLQNPTQNSTGRGSNGSSNENRGNFDTSQRGRGRNSRGRGCRRSRGRGYYNQTNNHHQPTQYYQNHMWPYPPHYMSITFYMHLNSLKTFFLFAALLLTM
ncbi:uncharacterized protein LOC143602701 [Bidens hawaiensis]|uniref:uncharacterized protein LOC143602701 n=1 Tax=Bidens hawaiensis TaxID=980011 RepID=UPI00404939F8